MQSAIDRPTPQGETHPSSTQEDQSCLLEWCDESEDGGVQGLSWVVDPWIQTCPCRCHIQNVINELCGPSAGQDAKGSKCRCCPEGDGPPNSPMGMRLASYVHTHAPTHTRAHTHTYALARPHECARPHAHTHTHTHTHTRTHASHTYTRTRTRITPTSHTHTQQQYA